MNTKDCLFGDTVYAATRGLQLPFLVGAVIYFTFIDTWLSVYRP